MFLLFLANFIFLDQKSETNDINIEKEFITALRLGIDKFHQEFGEYPIEPDKKIKTKFLLEYNYLPNLSKYKEIVNEKEYYMYFEDEKFFIKKGEQNDK